MACNSDLFPPGHCPDDCCPCHCGDNCCEEPCCTHCCDECVDVVTNPGVCGSQVSTECGNTYDLLPAGKHCCDNPCGSDCAELGGCCQETECFDYHCAQIAMLPPNSPCCPCVDVIVNPGECGSQITTGCGAGPYNLLPAGKSCCDGPCCEAPASCCPDGYLCIHPDDLCDAADDADCPHCPPGETCLDPDNPCPLGQVCCDEVSCVTECEQCNDCCIELCNNCDGGFCGDCYEQGYNTGVEDCCPGGCFEGCEIGPGAACYANGYNVGLTACLFDCAEDIAQAFNDGYDQGYQDALDDMCAKFKFCCL